MSVMHVPYSCPTCKYDLRGQIASWTDSCPLRTRCPECGCTCQTADLLSAQKYPPSIERLSAPGGLVMMIFALAGIALILFIVWVVDVLL